MATLPRNLMPSAKDGVILDMTETSVNKIEAQTSKKVKGAKASKTPAIWMTLNRARRKFYQQLKATQNNATKIACIDEVAPEVYKSGHKMVWYDLLKESKRLTNLIDFNEYCHSLQRNPAFVAQHVAFEGSGVVNKVMRYGVESVLGDRILAYDEPLYNPVKIRGLLDEAKPTAPKPIAEPSSARVEVSTTLVETSTMEEQPEVAVIMDDTPVAEEQVATVSETAA